MTQPLDITLHALGEETASGQTAEPIDLLANEETGLVRTAARGTYDVVAVQDAESGVAVQVQTSPDGTHWKTLHTLHVINTTTFHEVVLSGLQRYVRGVWTLPGTGSPAITFSLQAIAHVVYCEPRDVLRYAVKDCAIRRGEITEDMIDACIAATDLAASYVRGSHEMPLSTWGEDLRMYTAQIAAAILVARKIENPEGPDAMVFAERDRAIEWLGHVSAGKIAPIDLKDETPEVFEGGSIVIQRSESRGW